MRNLWSISAFVILSAVTYLNLVDGVDRSNFKACDQSSFCRRYRALKKGETPYQLLLNSIKESESDVQVSLINIKNAIHFNLKLTALANNNFRLQVDEAQPLKQRYRVEFALKGEQQLGKLEIVERTSEKITVKNGQNQAVLYSSPFKIDLYSGSRLAMSLNAQGLLKFEQYRVKTEKPAVEEGEAAEAPQPVDEVESDIGAWEENFKGHHDTKPHGPSAVGLDFSFPGADYAYGIPEHADSLALKATTTTEPYRLYNLDVFEYELNNGMALYGSIPFLVTHGSEGTTGVLWLNAAETWVDIEGGARKAGDVVSSIVNFVSRSGTPEEPLEARFVSESGIIDAFLLLGPNPTDVSKSYADLTGVTPLPPLFSLGYHQCRWNYNDQEDVRGVDAGFDEHDIPYDVMWLDIEYTEGKKYFTWDRLKFPTPGDMMKNMSSKGHKMVVIIDPHIKRESGYFVHDDATSNGYYVKNKDGNDYEGWCWPGSASYLDFFNPAVRDYYASKYSVDNFPGTSLDTHIWNDMNEPSVFNGPEITMPKDCLHFGGWEHRDVHNLYGLTQVMSTHDGMLKRSAGKLRPFILTRSVFVGSQRYAAVWTGDNMAEWDHLQASIPMCLSISLAGMPFCGADIGGFFKNPDAELFYRWYQAGAFLPFMRAHAHIDTKRREPWLFNEEVTALVRTAVRRRYELLPMWYTMFHEHEKTGLPVMRPIWYNYPKDKSAFAMEDQFLLGDCLLVHPVTQAGVSEVSVYFPGETHLWYDLDALELFSSHGTKKVSVTKDKIPVYQRGGTIIPKKERIRRSSALAKDDPYTLQVALDVEGLASGTLYIDDGESYEYQKNNYVNIAFYYDGSVMKAKLKDPEAHFATKSWLERIVVLGVKKSPSKIVINSPSLGERELESAFNPNKHLLVIRKPAVPITEEWTIHFH